MSNVKTSILELVGRTPLLQVKQYQEKYNLEANYEVLQDCAKTYSHWIEEIRNSLLVPYSNGVMEGYNNKIKVLKRVAFGFRNFENFKARILLME